MRKFISFILYLFYRYYQGGRSTESIAYESAIFALLALIFFNVVFVMSLFTSSGIFFLDGDDPRWVQYLKIGFGIVLPGFLILRLLFPKSHITNLTYDDQVIERGGWILTLYVVTSFILVFFS